MFENLKNRCAIIICVLIAALYFLWPTYKLYFNNNFSSDLNEVKYLESKALGLGLDLKGGLRIILELDNKAFLQRLAKKNHSNKSKNEIEKIMENISLITLHYFY